MPDVTTAVDGTKLLTALAPAFAAGFAVQQGLQILDSLLNLDNKINPTLKKGLAGLVSLGLGFAFAAGGIHVLSSLSSVKEESGLDLIVSALVISAGTEGFNSIMKFIGYKKDAANPAKAPADNAADHGGGGPNALKVA